MIGGYADFGQNTQSLISIVLFSNEPIAAGATYQDPQKATRENGDQVPRCLLSYTDAQQNGYVTMGPAVDENGHSVIGGVMADASVTITEMTDQSIKGNFSGTAYLSTDATLTQKQLITEGSFYLKRIQ